MNNNNSRITLYLARLIQPMYGNNSSVKCIVNEHGNVAYVKDANVLLSLLDIEHPVAQLVVSVVSAHSHRYGSGVKSLMVMMGQLSEAYLLLQDQGLPRDVIISLMRQILDILTHKVQALKLNISQIAYSSEHLKVPSSLDSTESTCQQESTQCSKLGSSTNRLHANDHHFSRINRHTISEESTELYACALPEELARMFQCDTQESETLESMKSRNLGKCGMQGSSVLQYGTVESSNLLNCDIQGPEFREPVKSGHCLKLDAPRMMSETRVVHLQMKNADGNDDDVNDDIGWYFEGAVPNIQDTKSTSISAVTNTSTRTGHSDGQALVSSLKDTDQHDSDFDDCFDVESDVSVCRSQTDALPVDTGLIDTKELLEDNSISSIEFGVKGKELDDQVKEENVLSENENNIKVKVLKIVDDEFDSCFDDCEFGEKSVQTSQTMSDNKSRHFQTCDETIKNSPKLVKYPVDENVIEKKSVFISSSRHLNVHGSTGPREISTSDREENRSESGTKSVTKSVTKTNEDRSKSFETSGIGKLNKMLLDIKKIREKKLREHDSKLLPKSGNNQERYSSCDSQVKFESSNKCNSFSEYKICKTVGIHGSSISEGKSNGTSDLEQLQTWNVMHEGQGHRMIMSEVNTEKTSGLEHLQTEKVLRTGHCDTRSESTKAGAVSSKMDLQSLNRMLMLVQKKKENDGHKDLHPEVNVKYSSRHLNGLNEKKTKEKSCFAEKSTHGTDNKMLMETIIKNNNVKDPDLKLSVKDEKEIASKLCAKTKAENFEQHLRNKLAEKSKQTVSSSLTHSRHFKSFDCSHDILESSEQGSNSDGLSQIIEHRHSSRNSLNFEQTESSNKEVTLGLQAVNYMSPRSHLKQEVSADSSGQAPNSDLTRRKRTSLDEDHRPSSLRSEDLLEVTDQSKQGFELSLREVAAGLGRGCRESMELVLQAAHTQMRRTGVAQFNMNLMSTSTMSYLPSSKTGVVDGLVLECETDLVADLRMETHRNTLLVNGDLTSNFHHQGYKNSTKGNRLIGSEAITGSTSPDRWILECLDVLKQLSVTLILVKGSADVKVKDALRSEGILVVERVSFSVLRALRETTGVELVIYLGDCSQIHVCQGLTVKPCDRLWMDKMAAIKGQTTHVAINTATPSALQTILICHPSHQGVDIQEQEVMSCSRRLEAALHDGTVLPGGGCTEQFCSEYLIRNSDRMETSNKNQLYAPVVAVAMAEVFNNIVNMIGGNRPPPKNFKHCPEQTADSKPVCSCMVLGSCLKCDGNDGCSEYFGEDSDGRSDVSVKSDDTDVISERFTGKRGKQFDHFVKINDVDGVYDNFQSKMAAWSAAMDTVAMVTQTDAHIVTGVTSTDIKKGVFVNGVIL